MIVRTKNGPDTAKDFADVIAAMVEVNVRQLRRQPGHPCCARRAGVRFQGPGALDRFFGRTVIRDASELLRTKVGACGSIVAYDCAAARLRGEDIAPAIASDGTPSHHAVLERGNGEVLDPTHAEGTCTCGSS